MFVFFVIAPLVLAKSDKSGFVSLFVKDVKIDSLQKLIASGLLFRVTNSGLELLRKNSHNTIGRAPSYVLTMVGASG